MIPTKRARSARPQPRRPRLTVEGLEQRSLLAANLTAGLNATLMVAQVQPFDTTLTATFGATAYGAQIVVDGSDYKDFVTIQDMNTATGDVSLQLTQYQPVAPGIPDILISNRTVRLHAGRALDPYTPIIISTKGDRDYITNLSTGRMTVYAGDGADVISGGSAGEYIDAGAGNDLVMANGGNDTVTARDGDDTVYGGAGYDVLYGDGGNDQLWGGDDHDTLVGNAGDDILHGENGSDRLYGLTGNDSLFGDEDGQAVYDYLSGGEGDDQLDGGGGNDTEYGDTGNDTVRGGDGNDVLWGGAGDDTVWGDAGNDTLHGGDGDDFVYGGFGLDKLYGENGNDGLFGGANDGKDTLTGGAGADRFLMSANKGDGQNANREDVSTDATSADARPAFVNGYDLTTTIGSTPTTYDSKLWTDEDVLRVDPVLALLQREGHGTKLLKRTGGGDIGIVRHGTPNRGFNDGWIHMTDSGIQFGGGDTDLRGYLLHELGHNWQGDGFKSAGKSYWSQFKAISDWRTTDPNDPAHYTLSTNEGRGDRWYLTASGFASGYARTNENEDFAESFAAYFTQRAGWTYYNGGAGAAGAPAKVALIGTWAAGL